MPPSRWRLIMALLWVDGFENYGPTGNTVNPTSILNRKYYCDFSDRIDVVAGETGNAIRIDNSSIWMATPPLTSNRTLIVGFSFYYPTSFSDGQWLVELRTPAFNGYVVDYTELGVRIDTSNGNSLKWYDRGTYKATVNGVDMQPDTWYFFEMKVYADASNGTLEIKLDGNTVYTFNGDTQAGTLHNFFSGVLFRANNNAAWYLDNLYICDGTGNTNNDFLGTCKVYSAVPASDVTNNWTLSTGNDAYALLDEQIQGTDYVSSNTAGQLCKVAMGTVNVAGGTIAGVMVNCDVSCNNAQPGGTRYVKMNTYNGTGTANHIGNALHGSNSILCTSYIMENAADGTAWDSTTINALKVGVEVA